MTIEECYSTMNGDWEGIKRRLGNDALISKLTLKFHSSKDYLTLREAILEKNWQQAFMSCHTLKGVALNLGYNNLASLASNLTEYLRDGKIPDDREIELLFLSLTDEYNKIIAVITSYIDSRAS